MNKQDLINAVAKDTELSKTDAEAVINAVLSSIQKAAKKDAVKIAGFGTFKYTKMKARTGVNPQTGAKIKIPAKEVFKFKASKTLAL